jgi:hypothetical protein
MFRKLIDVNTNPARFDWRGFGGKSYIIWKKKKESVPLQP